MDKFFPIENFPKETIREFSLDRAGRAGGLGTAANGENFQPSLVIRKVAKIQ